MICFIFWVFRSNLKTLIKKLEYSSQLYKFVNQNLLKNEILSNRQELIRKKS